MKCKHDACRRKRDKTDNARGFCNKCVQLNTKLCNNCDDGMIDLGDVGRNLNHLVWFKRGVVDVFFVLLFIWCVFFWKLAVIPIILVYAYIWLMREKEEFV